jgi:hypothetical protein
MRMNCLWTLAILVAAFVQVISATQTGVESTSQRTAYKPKSGDFVIVCTLFKGRAPGATTSTPTEPITYDAHFEIGARVERVTLGQSPWRVGDRVTFLIHSPVSLLGSAFSGQQFALTFSPFTPTTKDDKVWFEPETHYLLQWIEPVKQSRP